MPTVLRQDGFLVRIYTNDHEPAHVHVIKGKGEAKINLLGAEDQPTIVKVWKMSNKEVAKAHALVMEHQAQLIEVWEAIHG
ncbi:MAG: DUF4160 domain-containing protein [Cyanobacteria bacterium P01_F01_bin.150]